MELQSGNTRQALIARHCTKRYRRDVFALDDVSVSVGEREVACLLGFNGSGKTTFLKVACGLVIPDSGRMLVRGVDASRRTARARGAIGAVLEGARNVYWNLSAVENIRYFGALRGSAASAVDRERQHWFGALDLQRVADVVVGCLSRGMKQRVALAVALVTRPAVLLLDEPTLGLDVASASIVRDVITSYRHVRPDAAVVVATHNMALAEQISDSIIVFRAGRVVEHSSVRSLQERYDASTYRVVFNQLPTQTSMRLLEGLGATAMQSQDGTIAVHFNARTDSQRPMLSYVIGELMRDGLVCFERVRPTLGEIVSRTATCEPAQSNREREDLQCHGAGC
jgi:ABC-2 type transport system ATP-binding protein